MGMPLKQITGYVSLTIITLIALYWFFTTTPIPQDLSYHEFGDKRIVFGIPNFLNVISNIFFFVFGITGLYKTILTDNFQLIDELRIVYIVLFCAALMIAFGSGYYHLWPENWTLMWDRLPMSIVFMALFTIIIGEFISVRLGKVLFMPLISAGMISVIYWYFSENRGEGDLRFYALIQFYSLLMIIIILAFFRSHFSHAKAYWLLLVLYALSKVFEIYDAAIFKFTGVLSGHTLKHVFAAMALSVLLFLYAKRQLRNE